MKIVAINGSPRKNGNTAQVLEVVRREVEAAGVESIPAWPATTA